jgi:hypothetical protein
MLRMLSLLLEFPFLVVPTRNADGRFPSFSARSGLITNER